MQNLKNVDAFEILITQKLLKCPKDPFVRSALKFTSSYSMIIITHRDGSGKLYNNVDTSSSGALLVAYWGFAGRPV